MTDESENDNEPELPPRLYNVEPSTGDVLRFWLIKWVIIPALIGNLLITFLSLLGKGVVIHDR